MINSLTLPDHQNARYYCSWHNSDCSKKNGETAHWYIGVWTSYYHVQPIICAEPAALALKNVSSWLSLNWVSSPFQSIMKVEKQHGNSNGKLINLYIIRKPIKICTPARDSTYSVTQVSFSEKANCIGQVQFRLMLCCGWCHQIRLHSLFFLHFRYHRCRYFLTTLSWGYHISHMLLVCRNLFHYSMSRKILLIAVTGKFVSWEFNDLIGSGQRYRRWERREGGEKEKA